MNVSWFHNERHLVRKIWTKSLTYLILRKNASTSFEFDEQLILAGNAQLSSLSLVYNLLPVLYFRFYHCHPHPDYLRHRPMDSLRIRLNFDYHWICNRKLMVLQKEKKINWMNELVTKFCTFLISFLTIGTIHKKRPLLWREEKLALWSYFQGLIVATG